MNRWQQARQPRRLTMEQRRIRKKKYGKACAECRSRKVKVCSRGSRLLGCL
jgi:ssDNA-binding Zn-finger/Zn-ribbon topoisomerase 1